MDLNPTHHREWKTLYSQCKFRDKNFILSLKKSLPGPDVISGQDESSWWSVIDESNIQRHRYKLKTWHI